MNQIKRKFVCSVLALAVALSTPQVLMLTGNDVLGSAYAAETNITLKTAAANDYESINLSWKKVTGVKTYHVYRASKKDGSYSKVASTSKTSYKDAKIEQNKTYYYKIKAVKKQGSSIASKVKSGKIKTVVSLSDIPKYSGVAYTEVNDNMPLFSKRMKTTKTYTKLASLDSLGRCGITVSCLGPETMPTEDRESIGMVKPSGWHTVRYDDLISDKYLYNRCHLQGFQLSGLNAEPRNLVTGTRYLNISGMLPFENEVADYIKTTGNHVLYRVIPVFKGKDLVCRGVQMEAMSVEDDGAGIGFNVYCYNVQPNISIAYATGDSWRSTGGNQSEYQEEQTPPATGAEYVLNTNTMKFHLPKCESVKTIKSYNRKDVSASRSSVIAQGYEPCKRCNP